MKRYLLKITTLAIGVSLMFASISLAQNTTKSNAKTTKKTSTQKPTVDPTQMKHGAGFVDENGDGYNDNAPDHDGDGIPNGVDPDYTRTGMGGNRGFIDLDGDGINDNRGSRKGGKGRRSGRGGYGIKDGTGVRPQNGTGNGARTGICDGTGPKGNAGRGRK